MSPPDQDSVTEPSKHWCPHCHQDFTCMPPQDIDFITGCMADNCISYDPDRDLDIKWRFKKPIRTDN